jgi:hypothetical protein
LVVYCGGISCGLVRLERTSRVLDKDEYQAQVAGRNDRSATRGTGPGA